MDALFPDGIRMYQTRDVETKAVGDVSRRLCCLQEVFVQTDGEGNHLWRAVDHKD